MPRFSKTCSQPNPKVTIGRMMETRLYPRYAARALAEAAEDSPVTLIHGPRQSGKTTLAQTLGARGGYAYVSLDDEAARAGAAEDPMGFVSNLPRRAILDEVQRAPGLFSAIKLAVDRRRERGRFILTGSTNVLLIPSLADSLAGRMRIIRLHPLAQAEIEANPEPGFLDSLFGGGFETRQAERIPGDVAERAATGGFPAALAPPTARRRANWLRDYADALVQRDVRDMARVRALDAMPRLLAAAASQTARLFNLSDLAAPFELSRQTIGEYAALLERMFLIERLPPWHSNRLSRMVKTPKLHMGDSGLACALLGADARTLAAERSLLGQVLETFAYQELRRLASGRDEPMSFFHFRDKDGAEVDIVIERGAAAVAGVEVKASATVRSSDFRGLRKLRRAAGDRFAGGAVLYDGDTTTGFGDGLYAVPMRALWEG